jgi:hypothetical protein
LTDDDHIDFGRLEGQLKIAQSGLKDAKKEITGVQNLFTVKMYIKTFLSKLQRYPWLR